MNNFTKRLLRISVTAIVCSFGVSCFLSCQKANPSPYSTSEAGVTHTVMPTYTVTPPLPDTTQSFKASINGGSLISFTPGKSISGSNTMLKGVSTYYTITLTFPTSTGPGGNYNIGFGGPGITATLINGSITYVVNNKYGDGFLTIDSISSKGKYYGAFNFIGEDTLTLNSIIVNQGSFSNM